MKFWIWPENDTTSNRLEVSASSCASMWEQYRPIVAKHRPQWLSRGDVWVCKETDSEAELWPLRGN